MCMAEDSFERRISFAFLQDIKERFLSTYSKERANTALPYGLNEFAKVIEKQMVRILESNGNLFVIAILYFLNFIKFSLKLLI